MMQFQSLSFNRLRDLGTIADNLIVYLHPRAQDAEDNDNTTVEISESAAWELLNILQFVGYLSATQVAHDIGRRANWSYSQNAVLCCDGNHERGQGCRFVPQPPHVVAGVIDDLQRSISKYEEYLEDRGVHECEVLDASMGRH